MNIAMPVLAAITHAVVKYKNGIKQIAKTVKHSTAMI